MLGSPGLSLSSLPLDVKDLLTYEVVPRMQVPEVKVEDVLYCGSEAIADAKFEGCEQRKSP
jgi:hypothetical protein